MNTNIMGRHVLMDIEQADPALLNDPQYLTDLMESAAAFIGVTVLHTHSHQFSPQGVTAFIMLAESHMSIHTWPESGDAALDVFTCGEADPREAADFIMTGLGGWSHETNTIMRYKLDDPSVRDL